ncbi:MAG: MFS transporter [Pseudomonadota bacterium]
MTGKQGLATGGSPTPAIGRAVVLLGVAAFATVATMRVADPLIPQVAAEFDVTAGDAAIVSSALTISYAIGQFVYGPLGDRIGKLRLIAWMAVISAFTIGAAGFSNSLSTLGLIRFIGGATIAAIVPLGMAFVGDHVAYEDRQTMLARMLSGTIIGAILGQVLGGVIGEHFGWRAVFPMLGAVFLIVGALLLRELGKSRLPPPKLTVSISVGALIRGYVDLFKRPWARIVILVVFIEAFFFYGSFTFIGADLHQRFVLDYGTVGLILGVFGLGGIVYALSVRHLVRKLGERGLAMLGGTSIAVGLVCMPLVPLAAIPISQFLMGLGLYMLHNTLQTNATQMAPEARGLAVSTFANALFLGQAAGITAGGVLVDSHGFAPAYMISAVGLLILALSFARLLNRRQ